MSSNSTRDTIPAESLGEFVARFSSAFSLEGERDRTNEAHDQAPEAQHDQTRSTAQESIIQPPSHDVSMPVETGNITSSSEVVEDPGNPPSEEPRLQVPVVDDSEVSCTDHKVPLTGVSNVIAQKLASSRQFTLSRIGSPPINSSSLSPNTARTWKSRRRTPETKGARTERFNSTNPNAVLNGWRSCHGFSWRSLVVKLPSNEVRSTLSPKDLY